MRASRVEETPLLASTSSCRRIATSASETMRSISAMRPTEMKSSVSFRSLRERSRDWAVISARRKASAWSQ